MSVQGETKEKTRLDIREPGRYRVVMHNDDFTPMDFVVEILMEIFHKGRLEAVHLMMTVHESGQAAVGTYSYQYGVLSGAECPLRVCDAGAAAVCNM